MKQDLVQFFDEVKAWPDNKIVDGVIRFNMLRMRLEAEGILPNDFLKNDVSLTDHAVVETFRSRVSEEDIKTGCEFLYYFSLASAYPELRVDAVEMIAFLNEKLNQVDVNYEGSFEKLEESFEMETDQLLEELEWLPKLAILS